MNLNERLAGAVWGHLVGDAVGVPYEFRDASEIGAVHFGVSGTHHQPPGTWSDDGSLMLALLDSLLRERIANDPVFDTADQAHRFLAWADHKAYTPDGDGRFDIGGATSSSLGRLRQGTRPEEAGGTSERDNGNGSLMRILPLALVERDISIDELVEHAHRSSAITHGHAIAQAACALYVLIARRLLEGSARQEALLLASGNLRHAYHQRPDHEERLRALDTLVVWTGRSGRGYVVDSFWSAWDAFAGAKDYRESVERAIRYGGDTDTTACIAGGLAGLRFGPGGIPTHWLTKMRGAPIVEPLVAKLTGVDLTPIRAEAPAAGPAYAGQDARTSESHPIRVDWVNLRSVPGMADARGRLGMTFLLGKQDLAFAGRHMRDLKIDATALRHEHAVDTLVVLVEDHELDALNVPNLVEALSTAGMNVIRLPITDLDVPTDIRSVRELLADLRRRIQAGERVVVACRGGLGRTGTIVGSLLRDAGLDGPAAVALTRAARHGTVHTATQRQFVEDWAPVDGPAADEQLPFERYEGGGRRRLGRPRQGDLTARHGYGPPVFAQCGYDCVYCGLDMRASFEAWLQLSVDHVVPRQMTKLGYPPDLVEDVTNLVTCCRACNDFGNQYKVVGPLPTTDDAFFAIRDRVFRERRAAIRAKREQERATYARLPDIGPDRPPVAGEDA